MKILKIENGQGHFSLDGQNWKLIDQIGKDDLMKVLNLLLESDVEMDEFSDVQIKNQAHQIIYKGIFEKFNRLIANKNKFKDESDRTYLDAIKEYQIK